MLQQNRIKICRIPIRSRSVRKDVRFLPIYTFGTDRSHLHIVLYIKVRRILLRIEFVLNRYWLLWLFWSVCAAKHAAAPFILPFIPKLQAKLQAPPGIPPEEWVKNSLMRAFFRAVPNAKKQFQTYFQDCVQMSENVNFFVTYFDHDCAIVKPSRKWNELVLRR